MRTPRSAASSQTRRMVEGSPAWKPQATLALVTTDEQGLVVGELPAAEAFAEVGVEVDDGRGHRVAHVCPFQKCSGAGPPVSGCAYRVLRACRGGPEGRGGACGSGPAGPYP